MAAETLSCVLESDESHRRLLPHDSNWGRVFREEAKRVRPVFGDQLVQVEHIGSTAIPSLVSKPIIDIVFEIREKEHASSFIEPMTKAGYEFHSSSSERHFFKRGSPTTFHLSISYADFGGFLRRQTVFRDYLRENHAAREEYAALKKALLKEDPEGTGTYIYGKSEFVMRILGQAGFRE